MGREPNTEIFETVNEQLVYIGDSQKISRKHAKIAWNHYKGEWEIEILSKNKDGVDYELAGIVTNNLLTLINNQNNDINPQLYENKYIDRILTHIFLLDLSLVINLILQNPKIDVSKSTENANTTVTALPIKEPKPESKSKTESKTESKTKKSSKAKTKPKSKSKKKSKSKSKKKSKSKSKTESKTKKSSKSQKRSSAILNNLLSKSDVRNSSSSSRSDSRNSSSSSGSRSISRNSRNSSSSSGSRSRSSSRSSSRNSSN